MRCTSATVACLIHAARVDWDCHGGVTVLSGGAITARQGGTEGPFTGFTHTHGSQHGGFAYDSPAEPYGSAVWPRLPGKTAWPNNGGGGSVWIRSAGDCRIDAGAEIAANSWIVEANRAYGSGGSLLMQCASFSGSGDIRVDGGGTLLQWAVSSGAGGRVALYADSSTFTGHMSALGGLNKHGRQGGPGTMFTKVREWLAADACGAATLTPRVALNRLGLVQTW